MPDSPLRIVLKTDPLTEEYLPTNFVSREAQLRELLDVLTMPGSRGRGIVAWLHGPPGSGKSSSVRAVLHQLEEGGVRTAYVNCSHRSFFGVLEAILGDLGAMVRVTRDTSFKLERLHAIAKKQPLAIALEELDLVPTKREVEAILYNLCRLPNVMLLCVTQSRALYLDLEPRVASRIRPLFVEFPRFTSSQLVRILEARAEASLARETWCTADLQAIAAIAEGDARVAVQALRVAAYLAEKRRSPSLGPEDIREGLTSSSQLKRKYALAGMTEHHRLIYSIVRDAVEVPLPVAWKQYVKLAKEQDIPVMARRTFNQYRQALVASRLLTERYAKGRQNTLLLRVVE